MRRKTLASSASLLLGMAFLLPFWEAALRHNDDVIFALVGFGFFFQFAVLVWLLILAWMTLVYSMRPFHRSLSTFAAALGLGGFLAGVVHVVLAGRAREAARWGSTNVYEDSFTGFWLAVATAVAIGIALGLAAPRRRGTTGPMTAPSRKVRPPSAPR